MKPKKRYLYDTTCFGEPELQKFIPQQKLSYYKSQREIVSRFEIAKSIVLNELDAKIKILQSIRAETAAYTAETCPVASDPY